MNYQTETASPAIGRGRALAAALALASFLVAVSVGTTSLFDSPPRRTGDSFDAAPSISTPGEDGRRSLSVALPGGGCRVTRGAPAPSPIPPTWQASFPGSGARMTWSLVEALTGVRTNDDYDSQKRGYERVVAVKTHYPVKNARRKFGDLDPLFGRAMVLLRNPINAIPSYFNLQYEHLNHLPNHSTRGPNEDWIRYRDDRNYDPSAGVVYLVYQLNQYERFASYWMERYPERSQLLLLSYEDLTDDVAGPVAAARIAAFLGEAEGVEPVAAESVPCVWETVVNYKNAAPPAREAAARGGDVAKWKRRLRRKRRRGITGKKRLDPSSLRVGPKERPYTTENLQMMLDMLQRLVDKFSYDEEFVRIIRSYMETVSNTVPKDD